MIYQKKRKKNHRNKDNISIVLAPEGSVATQFIVCSVGIGETPQQAK